MAVQQPDRTFAIVAAEPAADVEVQRRPHGGVAGLDKAERDAQLGQRVGEEGREARVVERVDERLVELHVGVDDLRRLAARRGGDHVDGEAREELGIGRRTAAQRLELDEAPDLEDLVDVGRGERRHHGAPVDAVRDEALGLEPADALTHRVAGHAERLGEAHLAQACAGRQLSPQDA